MLVSEVASHSRPNAESTLSRVLLSGLLLVVSETDVGVVALHLSTGE